MDTSLERLSHEALSLTLNDRALLATRILDSMTDAADRRTEQSWYDLAESRLSEIQSGAVQAVSEEEVGKRVRARLR